MGSIPELGSLAAEVRGYLMGSPDIFPRLSAPRGKTQGDHMTSSHAGLEFGTSRTARLSALGPRLVQPSKGEVGHLHIFPTV